jgi:signal transduction histidine kinase
MSNSNKKHYALLLIAIIGALNCFAQKTLKELYTLSNAQFQAGNYADALNNNNEALKIAEQSNNYAQITYAHLQVGKMQYFLGFKPLALKSFYSAKQFSAIGHVDSLNYIINNNIGAIYTEMLQNDSALMYMNKALAILQNTKRYGALSQVESIFGDFYMNNMGNLPEAKKHIDEALRLANLSGNVKFKVFASNKLIGYYEKNNNKVLAMQIAQESVTMLDSVAGYMEEKMYANRVLSGYLSKAGSPKANEAFDTAWHLRDSVFKNETANKVANYKVLYDTEKKENENKLLQQENSLNKLKIEARNKTITGLLISVALIVLLIMWRLNVIKLKKKLAEIETEKKLQYDRERISRDLHDNVGGQLSYVMFSLEGNEELSKEKQIEKSHHLATALRGVTGNLRETIWALNKEELTIQDISDKLKLYTRNMFAYNDIKLKFNDTIENDIPLNPAFALNIFRICQEVINNVFKHAQATELNVSISKKENIQITITDNGIGFTTNTNDSNSFGLSNLQTRANEINATLTIKSEINKGTSITLIV